MALNLENSSIHRNVDFDIFFSLYFSAKDFSLNTVSLILKFHRDVKNSTVEGTFSQIFYLGPSFHFI